MAKQAILLAAGLGTRLQPYTEVVPKVMLPILGKPLLEWHVMQYKKHGVTEFFFNTHYLPEVIKDHFGNGSKFGVEITYAFEPTIMGTAGGMKNFEPYMDDAFFLNYGDTFSLVDYTKLAEAFSKHPDAIGMQKIKETDDYADSEIPELDKNGKFTAAHAKPHTKKYLNPWRTDASYVWKREVFEFIPAGTPYEIGLQLIPDIIAKGGAFYGYECDDYSKGIDTVEKWREVEAHLLRRAIEPWW